MPEGGVSGFELICGISLQFLQLGTRCVPRNLRYGKALVIVEVVCLTSAGCQCPGRSEPTERLMRVTRPASSVCCIDARNIDSTVLSNGDAIEAL